MREEDGIYLCKGGTGFGGSYHQAVEGLEPYSEFYAAQVAEALGFRHVKYELAKHKGRLCSKCKLFTSDRYGYGLMPHLDVSARSAENDYYAIRNYLRDKHPALFRGWMDFPYELTEELLSRLEALEKFRFRKQRHYNWSDERCAVLSGFLQKRADDILRFGRKAGLKRRGSDKVGEWYF